MHDFDFNSSVTFIGYLMFMHVECFISLNAGLHLYLYGQPFEIFWEALSFVLRAAQCSWIFHFLLRLLPVITLLLCSSRTYYYRCYTLLQGHILTHLNTCVLDMPTCRLACTHSHTHLHTVQVVYLHISIWMCTFNLPFSAQVLSDAILPARLI